MRPRERRFQVDAVDPVIADLQRALRRSHLAEAEVLEQAQAARVARVDVGAQDDEAAPRGTRHDRAQGLAREALPPHRGREDEAELVGAPQAGLADERATTE